jgi:hypothetical protein
MEKCGRIKKTLRLESQFHVETTANAYAAVRPVQDPLVTELREQRTTNCTTCYSLQIALDLPYQYYNIW